MGFHEQEMNFLLALLVMNLLIGGVIAFVLWMLRGKPVAPVAMAIFGGLYAFALVAIIRAGDSSSENMMFWLFALLIPSWPFSFSWILVSFILSLLSSFISADNLTTISDVILIVLWIVLGHFLGKYLKGKSK